MSMAHVKAMLSTPEAIRADAVAFLVFQEKEIYASQLESLGDTVPLSIMSHDSRAFEGKEDQTLLLHPRGWKTPQLILIGAGKAASLDLEKLRRAAATAAKTAKALKARSIAIIAPSRTPDHLGDEEIAHALAEGAALSVYRFDKYLTDPQKKNGSLREIQVVTATRAHLKKFVEGVRRATIMIEATCLARDLENAPGNEIVPRSLAEEARVVGRKAGFNVTVFDERRIARLKMGGLLGVSQASVQPPRFIVMEYNRLASRRGTVVLVGKGITFDAGGISIKPAANMAEMKMDMSGAAAVLGTLQAVARLRLPVHIVGLVPAAENVLGGGGLKPGDILTHYNGKTSEIDNTDAEGRLILADALSYASRYKPDLVIDLATLTGAVVVALGHVATGMLGNDEPLMARLKEAGERTHERVWQLPMFEEYEQLVKSDIADVKNTGGRWAGAITAAMFLKQFIGNYRWIHLDIAGTAIMEEAFPYIPKGGSGVGVRLLTDFLTHWRTD